MFQFFPQVKQQVQRYEAKPHAWQAVGPAFDRASSRKHTFCSKPIAYISGISFLSTYCDIILIQPS